MYNNNNYILASSSKSRLRILKNSGFPFKSVHPTCDEEKIKNNLKKKLTSPSIIAKKLSFEKARSVSKDKKYINYNVIGCDTLIYINNSIFDKAKSIGEAKQKIQKLSGKTHKIVSGVTICKNGKKIWQCSEVTSVKIRNLNKSQINLYLKKTGLSILSSVGCYQAELLGPQIIENIKGDLFNVMGLPLFKLLNHIMRSK